MKLFILFFLINVSHAALFVSVQDIQNCSNDKGADLFSHKAICESDKSSECVEYPGGPCYQYDVVGGVLSLNLEKKSLYESKIERDRARDEEILVNISKVEKGKKVIGLFKYLNDSKNLTTDQMKQQLSNIKIVEMIEALSIGNLDIAKNLITSIETDGVLFTENDKSELIGEINK